MTHGVRSVRAAVLVAASALALFVGACSAGSERRVGPTDVDFLAELVSADLDRWRVVGGSPEVAWTTGGSDSPLRVGPATFQLADGTVLDVRAETPGGNFCELFGAPEQPSEHACIVAGQFDETGAVAWFSTQSAERREGLSWLIVDHFEGRDAIVAIGTTWAIAPIRADAALVCDGPGDLSATPVQVPPAAGLLAGVNELGEVVAVDCLYDY